MEVYLATVAVCAASVLLGGGIRSALGASGGWTAPTVGLAALLVLADAAVSAYVDWYRPR